MNNVRDYYHEVVGDMYIVRYACHVVVGEHDEC